MGAFQTFLYTYPAADYAWELFKGVSPTIIALLTIYLSNKRSSNSRKKDWEIKKVHDMMDELIVIDNFFLSVSKEVNDCLCKMNPEDRRLAKKGVYSSCNSMIHRTITFCDSYTALFSCLNIEIDFADINVCVDNFQHEMYDIINKYISESLTDESLDEINDSTLRAHEKVKEKMSETAKVIVELMK